MPAEFDQLHAIHYLPIVTTIVSAAFLFVLVRHYVVRRSGPHILWWAIGAFTYGLGTGLESAITLGGNTIFLNKAWYVAGALLGGYPLAQGTVYLLLKRRTANLLTWITLPFLAVVSVLVFLSPVLIENFSDHKPTGAILAWKWVRLCTPFINLYAVFFLIGGAILSSLRYRKGRAAGDGARAQGNALIAFGALLPGIGGSMAKAGMVEALYVGELVGLLFIWAGYALCVRAPAPSKAAQPDADLGSGASPEAAVG